MGWFTGFTFTLFFAHSIFFSFRVAQPIFLSLKIYFCCVLVMVGVERVFSHRLLLLLFVHNFFLLFCQLVLLTDSIKIYVYQFFFKERPCVLLAAFTFILYQTIAHNVLTIFFSSYFPPAEKLFFLLFPNPIPCSCSANH